MRLLSLACGSFVFASAKTAATTPPAEENYNDAGELANFFLRKNADEAPPPGSFCTICTDGAVPDFFGYLLTLNIHHPRATVFVLADQTCRNATEAADFWVRSSFSLTIHWVVDAGVRPRMAEFHKWKEARKANPLPQEEKFSTPDEPESSDSERSAGLGAAHPASTLHDRIDAYSTRSAAEKREYLDPGVHKNLNLWWNKKMRIIRYALSSSTTGSPLEGASTDASMSISIGRGIKNTLYTDADTWFLAPFRTPLGGTRRPFALGLLPSSTLNGKFPELHPAAAGGVMFEGSPVWANAAVQLVAEMLGHWEAENSRLSGVSDHFMTDMRALRRVEVEFGREHLFRFPVSSSLFANRLYHEGRLSPRDLRVCHSSANVKNSTTTAHKSFRIVLRNETDVQLVHLHLIGKKENPAMAEVVAYFWDVLWRAGRYRELACLLRAMGEKEYVVDAPMKGDTQFLTEWCVDNSAKFHRPNSGEVSWDETATGKLGNLLQQVSEKHLGSLYRFEARR
eukprot:g248.t1